MKLKPLPDWSQTLYAILIFLLIALLSTATALALLVAKSENLYDRVAYLVWFVVSAGILLGLGPMTVLLWRQRSTIYRKSNGRGAVEMGRARDEAVEAAGAPRDVPEMTDMGSDYPDGPHPINDTSSDNYGPCGNPSAMRQPGAVSTISEHFPSLLNSTRPPPPNSRTYEVAPTTPPTHRLNSTATSGLGESQEPAHILERASAASSSHISSLNLNESPPNPHSFLGLHEQHFSPYSLQSLQRLDPMELKTYMDKVSANGFRVKGTPNMVSRTTGKQAATGQVMEKTSASLSREREPEIKTASIHRFRSGRSRGVTVRSSRSSKTKFGMALGNGDTVSLDSLVEHPDSSSQETRMSQIHASATSSDHCDTSSAGAPRESHDAVVPVESSPTAPIDRSLVLCRAKSMSDRRDSFAAWLKRRNHQHLLHTENPKVRDYYGAPLEKKKVEVAIAKRSRSGDTKRQKGDAEFKVFEDELESDDGQESKSEECGGALAGVGTHIVDGKENMEPAGAFASRPESEDGLEGF
ncbi:hypothetical protein LTR50_001979 [Elasticomyces elasticus]|nr:hypothetical protein LTR50_001979 [Elasticomyces elasticus]